MFFLFLQNIGRLFRIFEKRVCVDPGGSIGGDFFAEITVIEDSIKAFVDAL